MLYLHILEIHSNEFEIIMLGVCPKEDVLVDNLFVINQKCPKAVFSHNEAFHHHGLSDREHLSILLRYIAAIMPSS